METMSDVLLIITLERLLFRYMMQMVIRQDMLLAQRVLLVR